MGGWVCVVVVCVCVGGGGGGGYIDEGQALTAAWQQGRGMAW